MQTCLRLGLTVSDEILGSKEKSVGLRFLDKR